jgi:hypothetical protein
LEITAIGDSLEVLVIEKLVGLTNVAKDKPCFLFLVIERTKRCKELGVITTQCERPMVVKLIQCVNNKLERPILYPNRKSRLASMMKTVNNASVTDPWS